MKSAPRTFEVPHRTEVIGDDGLISGPWEQYFRNSRSVLDPLGVERTAPLTNNQSSAVDVEGLNFDSATVSHAIIDYLIQRVTTGTGATEKLEGGSFHLIYRPTSNSWQIVLIGTPGPDVSGITLSVTGTKKAKIQYTSTNMTGTASISKITYRARTLAAKVSTYSKAGE